jgi:hypothetical protein
MEAGARRSSSQADDAAAPPPGREAVCRALRAGRKALDENEAKTLLSAYGIRTPFGRVVATVQEAARAVEMLNRPAVIKALGPDIQHKSDCGLIVLDVRDAAGARASFHRVVDHGAHQQAHRQRAAEPSAKLRVPGARQTRTRFAAESIGRCGRPGQGRLVCDPPSAWASDIRADRVAFSHRAGGLNTTVLRSRSGGARIRLLHLAATEGRL